MDFINTTYKERVRYEISCDGIGKQDITDPIGWNEDQKEYARNENYHGIVAKFSNNLTFIEDGADFINLAFDLFDIKAKVKLQKYIMNPKTDLWEYDYWGYLDMSTRKKGNKQVKIKFNSGGLEQDIKVREDDSFEIDRLTTANRSPIDELIPNQLDLDGRQIFLKSKWDKDINADETIPISVFSSAGNTRSKTKPFPLSLTTRSHEQAQGAFSISEGGENNGNVGLMLFNIADRQRILNFKGTGIEFKTFVTAWDFDWAIFQVCLTTYENGINYELKERRILFDSRDIGEVGGPNFHDHLHAINFDETITVEQGDSVAFEFFIKADLKFVSLIGGDEYFTVNISEMKGVVTLDEDSVFPATRTNVVLIHEAIERYLTICSNKKNIFKSNFYGRTDLGYPIDGQFSYTGLSHGFWIRGFEKNADDLENKFKPLTTSLKQILQSLHAVHNIGVGIETFGQREFFRVEDLKYFYQPVVTIKLPNQVSKLTRETIPKKYFSSVDIGYTKGGSYEEAFGLDEPNGKSNFVTCMDTLKEIYTALSPFRTDSYGAEFARRKQQLDYPTEDTSYDEDIFLFDMIKTFFGLKLRKYQDDFEEAPTGIFSPETAFNLRLSPINNLLRHGWYLANGFTKYPFEFVLYGSSTANSNLRTKLNGKPAYKENEDIINSELGKPRFLPEQIEFEYPVNYEILKLIEGFTVINGERVPNLYGLIEFTNDENEIERGYFLNLKPNKEGKWRVIKANI